MFDYIVAGAGTAGCTLASRLTENPGLRVLLIEAGPPDRQREIHIPAAFPSLSLKGLVRWNDTTEPQAHLNWRRLSWPRGKVLGGSGSIGAMIHLRGCRADYDAWRDLGNAGWGFDDLQPLFGAAFCEPAEPNLLSTVFLDACEACQVPRYREFHGPAEAGAGLFPVSRKKGARWSVADALLRPALGRGNLTVWTGIQVARVLIEAGRATGVEYMHRGSRVQVRAAREVILCAGAVGSPQLLLLSGIGPVGQLESLGIPVAAALPGVGENLQDHLAVGLSYSCTQPVSLAGSATGLNTLNYLTRKRGPLVSNILEAGAFAKSRPDLGACDLEILFAPLGSLERGLAAAGRTRVQPFRRVADAQFPRTDHADFSRPAHAAAHRSGVSFNCGRPRITPQGSGPGAPDRGVRAARRLSRRGGGFRIGGYGKEPASPGGKLQDGPGRRERGRFGLTGSRRGGTARGRCLDHAFDPTLPPRRHCDGDRRESRALDSMTVPSRDSHGAALMIRNRNQF